MKNVKLIAGFSAFGFVLSFFFGLFSKSGFGRIILFAFIFALVFAVLGFALQFVFDKVLDLNGEDDFSQQDSSQESSNSPGQNVDITVEDEDFPSEEGEPQFFVGTNHQMLEESDMKTGSKLSSSGARERTAAATAEKPLSGSSEKEASESSGAPSMADSGSAKEKVLSANASASSSYTAKAANDSSEKSADPAAKKSEGFVPINLGETPKNISGTEARLIQEVNPVSYDSAGEDPSVQENQNSLDEELDTLPDLEEITSSAPKITISSADEDSGSDGAVSASSKDVQEVTEGKDVTLMAKAISTLLAKDT